MDRISVLGFLCLCIVPLILAQEFRQTAEPQWMPGNPQTWRGLQRQNVEMQDLDYSCGAAALATLLREFYEIDTDEAEILRRMGKNNAASLADLARVVKGYGFKAAGYSLKLPDLMRLKIPAIVHLLHRGEGHFSVVRGIRDDGLIALADPSWGNRNFLRHQFARLWDAQGTGEGKVLLIVPRTRNTPIRRDFFSAPMGTVAAHKALRLIDQPPAP